MSNSRTPSTTACRSSEQTIRSHYDQLIYPSSAYHTSHPDRLATQAILHGMGPGPVNMCRVLELGCSDGGNLIPMALSLPSSEFVGIDLSPRQIAAGLSQVDALELKNVSLICQSITDLGPELGLFDYIIAHGVFSWVPPKVQDGILDVCRDHLTPQGVAYVSYNAYPGAHNLQMLREMMLYHTRGMEDVEQRARRAIDLVRFLAARQSSDDPVTFSLKECRDTMEGVPDPLSFVVHEYLESYNVPIYFHEFIQRAEQAGLQYVADADPASTSVNLLPGEVVAVLEEFSRDRIEREQYLDFLRGASFRRSLLCHSEVVLEPNACGERVHRLLAAAPVQEVARQEGQASGHTFRTLTGRTFSYEHAPTVDLLRRLSKRWPEQVACAELMRSGPADYTPAAYADLLCSLFRSGLIELHSIPFDCVAHAGERPKAGLLARRQAERGPFVTCQLHRTVKMEDSIARFLLMHLNGSRDRRTLAALLEQAVRDGRLSISYKEVPVLEHPDAEQVLLDLVERHLQKIAEVALLVDSATDDWERLNRAFTLHDDGLFAKAAEHYTEALEKDPSRVDLIYLGGLTSIYNKPPGEGAVFFRRLVERYGPRMARLPDPGVGGHDTDPNRVARHCEPDIRQDPQNVAVRVRWGCLLERQGRYQEAIEFYRQALDSRPRLAFLWVMVARSLLGMHQTEEAVQAFNRCLEPTLPLEEVLAGLGALFLWDDQPQQAVFYLERASEKIPDDPILLNNLADALYASDELLEALKCYDRIIGLGGASADTWFATGNALAAVGEYAQSLGAYRRSLEMLSSNPEVHYNLGVALYRLGDVDAALDHLKLAADQGMFEASLGIATAIPGSPKSDPKRIRSERQRFAEQVTAAEDPLPASEITVQHREENRPLEIGYVSAFFHKPNYMKPIWGLLNNHDRSRFRIHLFSDTPEERIDSGYRAHIEDEFHFTAGLSNRELAGCIREQQIDILVDLNGFSAAERLPVFAYRTAPLTVAWFNMYATSGFPVFDALISDEHVVRPEEETFYIERVVPLPVSYLTFEVDYPVPPVAAPPCVKNGYLTFGCLGSQYKITPAVLENWAAILDQAPTARMLIANPMLKSKVTGEDYIYPHFAKNGIQRERLMLSGPEDHFEFLKKYDEIDVALDTFPYNGGTTTMEAMWQGVPVLTFDGDRWASRTSASLLRNCHLADFVARDAEDYVARAVDLAEDGDTPKKLRGLRSNMRERLQASSVCDTAALARHMESVYLRLWKEKIGDKLISR